MSESHASGLVLRLSVPAARDYTAVASEAAVKVAELLGHAQAEGGAREAIEGLIAEVAPDGTAADITFEFHHDHGELRIEARCAGRISQARHPLPT